MYHTDGATDENFSYIIWRDNHDDARLLLSDSNIVDPIIRDDAMERTRNVLDNRTRSGVLFSVLKILERD